MSSVQSLREAAARRDQLAREADGASVPQSELVPRQLLARRGDTRARRGDRRPEHRRAARDVALRLDTQYRSMSLIFLATPFRWRPLSFQKDFH